MSIKIEARGKFGGIKAHLEPAECELLMQFAEKPHISPMIVLNLAHIMGKKIKDLMQREPDLLIDRTEEQIVAILAKESEKAAMQLNQIKSGAQWQNVDANKLKLALLKHVK